MTLALLLALAAPSVPVPPPASVPSLSSPQEGVLTLEVRVTTAERGWARIDRGSADGLAVGDVVTFLPRQGGTFQGTVAELDERAARVDLRDPAFVPPAGTRGKVQLPRSRLGTAPPPRKRPAPKREIGDVPLPPPVFENRDEDWQEGEPLLARVRAVRPEERAPSLHGRSWASFEATEASEGDRSDSFARIGTSLVLENPFRRGDRIHADLEWNAQRVDVDDLDDADDVEFRAEHLSYAWGGTRFEHEGWEVGRFLQRGMVEFGVLDGAEWIVRRRNGHRYGAAVGFLPEPDEEFQTGSDLAFSGFYRWVADESEELGASAGFQKTFHDGAADRDLLVANFYRVPPEGWAFNGTAWVDFYTDGDDEKGTFMGLTQAYLSAGRRWLDGSSLDLVASHLEFPEIDRNEFAPVEDDQLADDHNERLALTHRWQVTPELRLLSGVGGWIDEDDEGGDAQLGFGLDGFLGARGFAEALAFGTAGRFQSTLGGRFSAGCDVASGRWAVDYEFTQNRLDGFTSANDDLPQHRLRLRADHAYGSWDLSWRIEGLVYDDENAITIGLYLQRSHY